MLGNGSINMMFKLSFYVPATHLDSVKQAVFSAGAGHLGNYDQCCWQTLGEGQFRPLPGSHPFVGEIHQLETVPEYKVEMICWEEVIRPVIAALRLAHPYESPAYEVWVLEEL